MKSEDTEKFELLVEHLDDQFALLAESIDGTHQRLSKVEKRLDNIEKKLNRIEPMPEVARDHSKTLQNHERRLLAVNA